MGWSFSQKESIYISYNAAVLVTLYCWLSDGTASDPISGHYCLKRARNSESDYWTHISWRDQNQRNVENLYDVRREASRHFRNKNKESL